MKFTDSTQDLMLNPNDISLSSTNKQINITEVFNRTQPLIVDVTIPSIVKNMKNCEVSKSKTGAEGI